MFEHLVLGWFCTILVHTGAEAFALWLACTPSPICEGSTTKPGAFETDNRSCTVSEHRNSSICVRVKMELHVGSKLKHK